MIHISRIFWCALSSILFILASYGCSTIKEGFEETVEINTVPEGATVVVNGKTHGITPTRLDLSKKRVYEVRVIKEGYAPAVEYITPEPKSPEEQVIRFGPLDDAGYYNDLDPNPLVIPLKELDSDIIKPDVRDPAKEMTKQVLELDRLLNTGKITPEEHKRMLESLIEFFQNL